MVALKFAILTYLARNYPIYLVDFDFLIEIKPKQAKIANTY